MQVMDKHLGILADKHMETKFIKVFGCIVRLSCQANCKPLGLSADQCGEEPLPGR